MENAARFIRTALQEYLAWLSAFMPDWIAEIIIVVLMLTAALLAIYIITVVHFAAVGLMGFAFRLSMRKSLQPPKLTDVLSYTISSSGALWASLLRFIFAPFRFLGVGSWRVIVTIVYCLLSWLGIIRAWEAINSVTDEKGDKYNVTIPNPPGPDFPRPDHPLPVDFKGPDPGHVSPTNFAPAYAIKAESIVRESLVAGIRGGLIGLRVGCSRLIKRLAPGYEDINREIELQINAELGAVESETKSEKRTKQSDTAYLMERFLDDMPNGGMPGFVRFMIQETGAEVIPGDRLKWTDPLGKTHKPGLSTLRNQLSQAKDKRRG